MSDELQNQTVATSTETTETTEQSAKKKARTPIIATSAAGLMEQAPLVYTAWLNDKNVILPFTGGPKDLKKDIDLFEQLLYNSSSLKAAKSPQSGLLKELNKRIDYHLSYPKDRLKLQVGKEAYKANLPCIGIMNKKGSFRFPQSAGERKIALATLIATSTTYNWTEEYCSAAFWQGLLDEFVALTSGTTQKTQTSSTLISDKDAAAERIRKVLRSIAGILTFQYPDTYESVLRSWGFLREKN